MEPLTFHDLPAWEAWLADHHETAAEAWLVIAKKGAARPTITAAEAGDVAICFGWIDSQRRGLDAEHFLQRYSPRRKGARWSQVNVDRAEALVAAGRMRAAGHAQIEAAKADGRWAAAYPAQRDAKTPDDLAAALAANPAAAARFASLDKTSRYAVILKLTSAPSPAARRKRLVALTDLLAGGDPVPPPQVG
ncbi:YdeI/OmpD-associated family protein [Asanoa sp. WMMD1127]|uniref:YdeI/OmpD-associated family protein n=1 Tax=Asanoa sp. WMMD1127 TaxID=3016107 RepID=UPI002417BCC2|nr:YdeI/OmpD-associated family protein [Asanoa sp. WMMD1127]MDG4827383.1 YdeI/OmpD-associated family protein [Asanoa sp. WMMD1127]